MGYHPLVAWSLPLADLHHLRLTNWFPKTSSAIQPMGTPSAFCTNQIVPGFVVYYLNTYTIADRQQKLANYFKRNYILHFPQKLHILQYYYFENHEGARHCRKPLGRSVRIYQNSRALPTYKILVKYFQFCRIHQNQGFCMEIMAKYFSCCRIDQNQAKIPSKSLQYKLSVIICEIRLPTLFNIR